MRQMKDSGIEWIGLIPGTWTQTKLKYHYSFEKGQNAALYTKEYIGNHIGEFPVYSGQTENLGVMGYIDSFDYDVDECLFTTTVGARVMTPRVLFGRFSLSQNCLIMKQKSGILNKFTYYMLICLFSYEKSKIPSYMQPSLRIEDLNTYSFYISDSTEQKAIVVYLDKQCALIDNTIEKTKASIEEYKKLKQAIITQAVTKGVRGDRPMKDSGIEWIGEIPKEWCVYRIAALYAERNEAGNDQLPVLTVSINTGVSDRELTDDEQARAFVRSEDRTKYMRVYPGDLTYNMMRAWQGAFGAVRVDGMVSPAYVIAMPKREIDSRYMEALLRTSSAKEEMKRYSYGIADFRLRLYWDYFKTMKICLPPFEEQHEIADYLDVKTHEINQVIEKKEQFITELESYKKSMIYEYVTGKKEILTA